MVVEKCTTPLKHAELVDLHQWHVRVRGHVGVVELHLHIPRRRRRVFRVFVEVTVKRIHT
jgi:hypothetical protein